ncbi:MAG: hypothetical protein ACK559_27030 [bacterium]
MLIQAKVAAKQDHRRRIEENKKRREERERAAEVYQIVRNPNKIKKMKRKDLVKRDILGKVQALLCENPPTYKGSDLAVHRGNV